MKNDLCRQLGVDFPLFGFSHCRDVVAAVTRAGGFGVLGGATFTPESLDAELAWIDAQVDGRPYGVDLIFTSGQVAQPGSTLDHLVGEISDDYVDFTKDLLEEHGVSFGREDMLGRRLSGLVREVGEALLEVAFNHPIELVVNALGVAPPGMIERAHAKGIKVGALVGSKEHALRQVQAGVDIVVAQGTEAGGHCGEISTLVLVPEVVRALHDTAPVPVLAAGGIVTGQQMAACMMLGAQGAWTGSIWLATTEAETSSVFREKMVEASSSDTRRAKSRTGKPSRQLRSAWHDAWARADAPASLPMPLMGILSEPAFTRIDRSAEAGNSKARELVSYFVGQGVGLIDQVKSATTVMTDFKAEFADAYEQFAKVVDG